MIDVSSVRSEYLVAYRLIEARRARRKIRLDCRDENEN